MDQFPGNPLTGGPAPQQPASQEEKKVEKVTTGEVIVQKPTRIRRIRNAFFGDDGKSVLTHSWHEVIIPAGRDMIFDAGIDLLGRVLGVENRGRRVGAGNTAYSAISTLASKVQYTRPGFLQDPRQVQKQASTVSTRGRITIDDIILQTRVEADEVIHSLELLIQRFGRATVADLFDLVGVTGEWTDEKLGWYSMQGAHPHRVTNGYLLDLPRLQQLD